MPYVGAGVLASANAMDKNHDEISFTNCWHSTSTIRASFKK